MSYRNRNLRAWKASNNSSLSSLERWLQGGPGSRICQAPQVRPSVAKTQLNCSSNTDSIYYFLGDILVGTFFFFYHMTLVCLCWDLSPSHMILVCFNTDIFLHLLLMRRFFISFNTDIFLLWEDSLFLLILTFSYTSYWWESSVFLLILTFSSHSYFWEGSLFLLILTFFSPSYWWEGSLFLLIMTFCYSSCSWEGSLFLLIMTFHDIMRYLYLVLCRCSLLGTRHSSCCCFLGLDFAIIGTWLRYDSIVLRSWL